MKTFLITEIFKSIQGEGYHTGLEAIFVRFYGCDYDCQWCFGVHPGEWQPNILGFNDNYADLIPLTKVKVNDKLLTFDKNQNVVETYVTKVIKHKSNNLRKIVIGKKTYLVTSEHPFFTKRGLIAASDLMVNDEVITMTRKQRFNYEKSKYTFSKTLCLLKENRVNFGLSNGNYKTDYPYHNFNHVKWQLKNGAYGECEICGNHESRLLIHHIDENPLNDNWDNFAVVCQHCHNKLHRRGNNFKKFIENDSYIVKSNEVYVGEKNVYNISCHPYNSYIINDMWVHNCDSNRLNKPTMIDETQLLNHINQIKGDCQTIILTGGNPAIQPLDHFCKTLKDNKFKIHVETQGSIIPEWFKLCDWISFSPKYNKKDDFKLNQIIDLFNDSSMQNSFGEIRVVVDNNNRDFKQWLKSISERLEELDCFQFYLSALDKNFYQTIPEFDFIKLFQVYNELKMEDWKISLQIHKLMGVR